MRLALVRIASSISLWWLRPLTMITTLTASESVKKIMGEAKGESDSWFSRMRSELSTESSVNFHTKIILSPMKVSSSIVNYAENTSVDLVVVGTRGRSGFKRLLLGSVASDIITYAHCPVLVVK